ncbi:MAG: hypothetical protein E2581_06950 [Pseudomonas sp.]|uniref:ead/Ea22-like family protein n=1 Tax=Pseudomonas sp. TaxID=306 RepID=UPI001D81158A|nr:ead/Ea22-like family protein [Pseudomonas sp.]MPS98222.1 hypothetical protein [Pseudomonas sp.]
MTIDKEKLKALAKLATQGDWERDGYQVCPVANQNASLGSFGKSTDAAYVAALQPSVILALLAEIERHEAWRTAFLAERDAQMRQRDQLRAENDGLRKALLEASEEVATWGAYASEYFQEKHDLAGCVAKIHAAAMAKEAAHD